MLPLPLITALPWRLIGAVAACAGLFGAGAYAEHWRAGRAAAIEQADRLQQLQEDTRRRVVAQRKADDAHEKQTRRIGAQLADALDSLRQRPERPAVPGATQACPGATGAELYQQDAGFLAREAARADQLRADLARCQGSPDPDGSVTE